jgi:hypothetical protein
MKIIYEKQQQKIRNLSKLQKQTTKNTATENKNYPGVKNTTNTQFTPSEMQLLKKGLRHNLHYKQKNWLETLALEAETGISKINATEQQYYRHMVTKTIKKISQKDNTNNTRNKIEWKLMRNIRNKLAKNELIITKADKGKTIVILTMENYTQKVNNFIQENQFVLINNDPTKNYQKAIKHTMTQCNNIIPKENKWKYINMNPTAPTLRATIKLQKQNTPIRPIINWRNAPAYELERHLTGILHDRLHLPNTYNIQNSTHLTTDLQSIEINEDMRICSFDIENMYTNIPKVEVLNIIKNILKSMEQNYFRFNQQYYKQKD